MGWEWAGDGDGDGQDSRQEDTGEHELLLPSCLDAEDEC